MAGPSHKLPSGRAGVRLGVSDTQASTLTHGTVPSVKPPVSFDCTWGPAVDTLRCVPHYGWDETLSMGQGTRKLQGQGWGMDGLSTDS